MHTAFDGAVFSVMGAMIALNTLFALLTLFLFVRQRVDIAPACLWGIRVGLGVFVVASLEGFVMVARLAHTVGAPDGGPGLPLVNWSTKAGDLRVAHFLGLHALQALPLAGYLMSRTKLTGGRQIVVMRAIAIVYLSATVRFFTRAIEGLPL